MNKGEFVRAIAEQAGSTIKDAEAFYDATLAVLTKTLKKDFFQMQIFFKSY